jgi:OOP family OmpA-OmpF porin
MKKLNKVAMLFAPQRSQPPLAPIDRQLAQRLRRTRLEERHQRTVLARCQLDACHGCPGCDGRIWLLPGTSGSAACAAAPAPPACTCSCSGPLPSRSAPQPPAATKVTYAADAFFDFDKSVLKPEGKAKLDDLVRQGQGHQPGSHHRRGSHRLRRWRRLQPEAVGRRAEAVKAYLVSKGIEKNRVYTEGKGEKQPVADNKTAEGRAKNRRVEIEVVGTRANK